MEIAMSVFSNLFKSRDKPKDSTNGSGYCYHFGSTTSGNTVTERSAMQISAVYACVRVLSEAIASLPLHSLPPQEGKPLLQFQFQSQ